MFIKDLIDKKIEALLDYIGETIDETNESDVALYDELREFAEKNCGLLFYVNDEVYLILNFIGEKDFLLIPVEYTI